MKRINAGLILLVALGASLSSMFAVLLTDYLEPPHLKWETVAVSNAPSPNGSLIVDSVSTRTDATGCTNGFQAEMRGDDGAVVRLPVPSRALSDDGSARYTIVLADVAPGEWQVRLRETFNCGGEPEQIETPWIAFEVKE